MTLSTLCLSSIDSVHDHYHSHCGCFRAFGTNQNVPRPLSTLGRNANTRRQSFVVATDYYYHSDWRCGSHSFVSHGISSTNSVRLYICLCVCDDCGMVRLCNLSHVVVSLPCCFDDLLNPKKQISTRATIPQCLSGIHGPVSTVVHLSIRNSL